MKSVRVFAPASIANLGCGFDIMGLALDEVGDVLEMSISEGDGLSITNLSGVPLPDDIEKNVITPVVRKFMQMTGNKAQVDIVIREKIYPGSGIGSSSASSAAAAFGMNELYGAPLSEPLDLIKLPVPGDFYCAVVHPRLVVSTKEARSILPKQVPMHDAIAQWGNVGGLVAGLYSGNIGLIGRAMKDSIAEPYRKGFIPGFDDLREKILSHGSLAMNIAGSGPSVFALANRREIAVKAGAIMDEHFSALGIDHHCYVVKVSNRGARLTAY